MAKRFDAEFIPAPGLWSPHSQTIFASLRRKPMHVPFRRERWDTPDGDFLDLDFIDGRRGAPLVVVFHGLEGSSGSGYVKEMARQCELRRWSMAALNYRSCSGQPNRAAKSYSSGATEDPLFVLRRLRQRFGPDTAFYAAGFSLGGSVLLNLLADAKEHGLRGAVAVSTPYDLYGCVQLIDHGRGFARIYLRQFVPTMRAKALEKAARFPTLLDAARIRRAVKVQDIDEWVTAPLYGFSSARDYYAKCSTFPKLARIITPTLLISAEDDPLAPSRLVNGGAEGNPHLQLISTRHGGHVGFVSGTALAPDWWAEATALRFFDSLEAQLTTAAAAP